MTPAHQLAEKLTEAQRLIPARQYTPDGRGLFCANCGRTSIRHISWHGKRLCDLPKGQEHD